MICSCMNSKIRQRNDVQLADRHQIENTEARKNTQREREVALKSDMVPVKRYTNREGGDPQVRHGSCQETHKQRGR